MTEAEAIKVLKMVETHGSLTTNAKELAIKALEKQIAKDVYEAHFYREPFPVYRCPVCPNTFIERNQMYCQDCGQKILWDSEV